MTLPDQVDLVATQPTLRPEGSSTDVERAREALELVEQLRSDFKQRDELYQMIDRVIFLENAVEIPSAYRKTAIEVRSPLPVHITNNITAALSINAPTVQFSPIGIGESAEENAALREEFFFASWLRQEQEANSRIFRRFIHSLVTKGEGIIKTVETKKTAWSGYNRMQRKLRAELDAAKGDYDGLDTDSKDRVYDKKTEEFKRGAPYPISSTDVPPETFYYLRGEKGLSVAAEVKMIPYFDALVRYSAGLDKQGRVVPQAMAMARPDWARLVAGTNQMLEMVEVWDWQECIYILRGPGDKQPSGSKRPNSGLVVKRVKHGYGDPDLKVLRGPYFHALGITTSSREIAKQGLSVLFGYLHLFPLLDSLLTIQSQAAYSFGFPAYKRKLPPNALLGPGEPTMGVDSMEAESVYEEVVPGTIFPYDIEPLDQPRGGVDLEKTIALVRGMLEMALPSAAQGILQGDQAGYAINQAAHLARLAWDPIVDNAEFALAQRVGFESWMIEKKIKENVYVWGESPRSKIGRAPNPRDKGWLGIGPQDLEGVHRYRVIMKPETPSNLTLELRTHQQMLEMRVETPAQAIEALGNNPSDVERGWLLAEIKNDPAFREQMKQRVFKKLATIDQKNMQGVPGPGAAPQPSPAPPYAASPQGAIVPGISGQPFSIGPAQMQDQGTVPQPGNQPPGTPAGAPGGVRNLPAEHAPIAGQM